MTRVAVISDTHMPRGSRALPQECVDRLAAADLILHGGDVTEGAVLETLGELGPLHAVYGNMDSPDLRASLPKEHVVEAGGARIGMVHIPGPAAGRSARLVARFPQCDAVVYGHTHIPEVSREGATWILNPGSPTERRKAPSRTMLELEIENGEIRPLLVELP
ncbi:MAG TPA: metallophosphoesterase family protein [Gaiellaceae bacterium]|nr:metallophosphoesterase family protein [Gaiellaceae bacterium]